MTLRRPTRPVQSLDGLAQRITTVRQRLGLSQRAFAKRLGTHRRGFGASRRVGAAGSLHSQTTALRASAEPMVRHCDAGPRGGNRRMLRPPPLGPLARPRRLVEAGSALGLTQARDVLAQRSALTPRGTKGLVNDEGQVGGIAPNDRAWISPDWCIAS